MKRMFLFLALLMCSTITLAEIPADWQSPVDLVGGAMDEALKQISNTLEKAVISLIFALALLQAVFTGTKQLASGEADRSILNFGMIITWTGIALWLLGTAASPSKPGISNLADLLYWMQNFAFSIISKMTGGTEFSASKILEIGLQAYGYITLSVAKTTATNLVNALATIMLPGVGFVTALMVFFISAVIMVSCAYVAIKVFITKIEFSILVAIAPLSVAMIPFAPTREQGWAPFKGALSLIYRILILGGTVSAIGLVSKYLGDYVDAQAYGLSADVWTPLLSGAFAFSLLAFVAHKSDSIASAMASGSSAMSSGDLAGSVAAGVTAGLAGAAAVGAATAAASGGTGVKAMADVMKGMNDASPAMRGIQSVKSSLGLGGGGNAPPPKPTSTPPAPTSAAEKTMADAGSKAAFGKVPADAINAGAGALSKGGSKGEAMAEMINHGAKPNHAKAAVDAMASVGQTADSGSTTPEPTPVPAGGDGATAGIGGGTDTPQKTPQQEKMLAAIGKLMDRGGNLNQKIERDSASTSVSINTHNMDH